VISWPRPRLVLNVALALTAAGFVFGTAWEIGRARPLPPAPAASVPAAPPVSPVQSGSTAGSSVDATTAPAIAARNLFTAGRSEVAAVAPAPAGPKPVLHGVVMDGERSRAYLADPVAKRIFGYAVGDTVGGGRLEQIADDRIVIRRAEGTIEVPLQDPAKSRPATTPPSATPPPAPQPNPAPPLAATPAPTVKPSQ
jgi:hypothetical protein